MSDSSVLADSLGCPKPEKDRRLVKLEDLPVGSCFYMAKGAIVQITGESSGKKFLKKVTSDSLMGYQFSASIYSSKHEDLRTRVMPATKAEVKAYREAFIPGARGCESGLSCNPCMNPESHAL